MNYAESAKNAVFAGAVAAAGVQLLYGSQGSVNLLGMRLPSSVGVGFAAGGGSIAADVIHTYLPGTPLGYLGATATELIAAGAVTSWALDNVGLNNGMTVEGFGIGVASLLGGRQLDNFVSGGTQSLF